MRTQLAKWLCVMYLGGAVVGCQNNTETGALIGGGTGAALGAVIGNQSHGRAGAGALIGGAVGVVSGALIGHAMDEQQREAAPPPPAYAPVYVPVYAAPPPPPYYGSSVPAEHPLGKDDVISMAMHGVHDDVIIDRIDRSGSVFHLTASDEDQLRDAGVGEDVINAMRDTTRR